MAKSDVRFLTANEVAERYGIGVSTVWDWAKRQILPSPIRFGARCTRWRSCDLDEKDKEHLNTH